MPDVELNIPEYIKPVSLCSSSYGSSNVVDTLGPLSIAGALKSSLILFDSTPLPNENALNHFKLFVLPKSLEALLVSCVSCYILSSTPSLGSVSNIAGFVNEPTDEMVSSHTVIHV